MQRSLVSERQDDKKREAKDDAVFEQKSQEMPTENTDGGTTDPEQVVTKSLKQMIFLQQQHT